MQQLRFISLALLASLLLLQCTTITAKQSAILSHPRLKEWKYEVSQSRLPAHSQHAITILLKQQNLALLEKTFWEVSNPDSSSYGRYFNLKQVADLVSPAPSVLKLVESWLQEGGATNIHLVATKDAIRAEIALGDLEKLVQVRFQRFIRNYDGRVIIRSLEKPSIPQYIQPHIDLIRGINDFPGLKRKSVRKLNIDKPMSAATLARLRRTAVAGAPIVQSVAARTQVSVRFSPTCLNGQPTKALPACSDQAPAISSYLLFAVSTSDVVNGTYYLDSKVQPTCDLSNPDGSVSCHVTVPNSVPWLPFYTPVNVSVVSVFGDQSGPAGANAFPTAFVPPVTPQTLAKLYSIPPSYVATNATGTQAVVEFEQQYYSSADLAMFFYAMGLPSDTSVTVVGPNDETNPGVEANLDIQYIMGVAPGVPTTFWSIKANSSVEIDDILAWAIAMSDDPNAPVVNSLSYGMSANQVDVYLGDGYLARSNVEFQKLALRGITIIIASGDTGCGDLGPAPMSNPTCERLHPDWPSESPYITSIGSSYLTPYASPICFFPKSAGGIDCSANPLAEAAVSLEQGIFFTGGGGFSDNTTAPDYQQPFVNKYLQICSQMNLLPPANIWSQNGRAYPDFSTIGHNLMVASSGVFIPVDGTSASAPIFAGIIALLNDVRLNNNKPVLGFINPLLYKLAASFPASFYDVTIGSNRCGAYGFDVLCCDHGFTATVGFDAVTGIGSPNFSVLRDLI